MTKQPIIIASFANAYRVAVRMADATDQDQHVLATGDYTRPLNGKPSPATARSR